MTRPEATQRTFCRNELRDLDRRAVEDYGLPGAVLMENAGRGAAEVLLNEGAKGPVVICAGKGNNGGDGYVVARHLENHGIPVKVLLFCRPSELRGDAAIHFRVIEAAGTPIEVIGTTPSAADLSPRLSTAEWIVDAILGTGAQGQVREPYSTIIAAINNAPAKVLALDLPSGMDCDTGQPLGECVRADETATFVGRKLGFDRPGADAFTGRVSVVDIGVPRRMFGDDG